MLAGESNIAAKNNPVFPDWAPPYPLSREGQDGEIF